MLIVTSQVENRLREQRQALVNQLIAKGRIKQDRYDDLKARARLLLKKEYKVNDELLTELKAQRVIREYPGDILSTVLTVVFGVSLMSLSIPRTIHMEEPGPNTPVTTVRYPGHFLLTKKGREKESVLFRPRVQPGR